ncbi:efflux RND transporter periplasmic adaptor subunit [Bacteroidales bacterium]|nr:efflux RND transporter periplasmic adaptor subunit [Bacteroidales bacterium]
MRTITFLKKYRFIAIGTIVLLTGTILYLTKKNTPENNDIYAEVQQGKFKITVETSGELEAKNSTKIVGPIVIRQGGIWGVKILKIVPEGTIVKKGDFVAEMDKSEVAQRLDDSKMEQEDKEIDYAQSQLDTTIQLQKARNNIENLLSNMEELKLELEKSIYEPPVTIKQVQNKLDKAKRNYEQAIEEYKLTEKKAISNVREQNLRLQKATKRVKLLDTIIEQLDIKAPESGMVIYARGRHGKYVEGSTVSTWDFTVAELPDLDTLISKIYVNEVDIRKVKAEQQVEVTFDAFPDKHMTGKVITVANSGISTKGTDAKVFEVIVEMIGSDKDIKPGMTTGNTVITNDLTDAIYLPIETVYSQGDSVNYVFLKRKLSIVKKEVWIGERNNQDIIITKGLLKGDKVLFLPPENSKELEFFKMAADQKEETLESANNTATSK